VSLQVLAWSPLLWALGVEFTCCILRHLHCHDLWFSVAHVSPSPVLEVTCTTHQQHLCVDHQCILYLYAGREDNRNERDRKFVKVIIEGTACIHEDTTAAPRATACSSHRIHAMGASFHLSICPICQPDLASVYQSPASIPPPFSFDGI
jgi:hypothetical protein